MLEFPFEDAKNITKVEFAFNDDQAGRISEIEFDFWNIHRLTLQHFNAANNQEFPEFKFLDHFSFRNKFTYPKLSERNQANIRVLYHRKQD